MNFKSILYTTGLTLTAYLSWHFGLWLAPDQHNPPFSINTNTTSESLISTPQEPPSAQTTHTSRSSLTQNPAALNSTLSEEAQSQKELKLSPLFSDNPEGRALFTAAKWMAIAAAVNTPEAQAVATQVALLKANPNVAFEELKKSLPQMGPEFAQERQSLIQLASQLDVDTKEKLQLLGAELTQSSLPLKANDFASFNGVNALELMMQQTDDAENVLPFLKEALKKQSDPPTRNKLISTFSKKFPDQAQQLKNEFL